MLRAHPQPVPLHLPFSLLRGAVDGRLDGEGDRVTDETNKRSGYFGFRMQFPATYDREFYTTSQSERDEWITHIRDMTEVRRIEDFYDIREKIGEGRFAAVYRVGVRER